MKEGRVPTLVRFAKLERPGKPLAAMKEGRVPTLVIEARDPEAAARQSRNEGGSGSDPRSAETRPLR